MFFEIAKTFGFVAAMISYYFLSYLKTSIEASCLVIVFLAMLVCMLALSIRTCFYTKDLKTISSMVLLRRKYYHTFLFFLSFLFCSFTSYNQGSPLHTETLLSSQL